MFRQYFDHCMLATFLEWKLLSRRLITYIKSRTRVINTIIHKLFIFLDLLIVYVYDVVKLQKKTLLNNSHPWLYVLQWSFLLSIVINFTETQDLKQGSWSCFIISPRCTYAACDFTNKHIPNWTGFNVSEWKNEKLSTTEKIFCEINSLQTSFIKTLVSSFLLKKCKSKFL